MSQNKPLCLLYVCVSTMRNDWQVRGGGPAPVREATLNCKEKRKPKGKEDWGSRAVHQSPTCQPLLSQLPLIQDTGDMQRTIAEA